MPKSALLLSLIAASLAAPNLITKRTISPNESCGGSSGHSCPTSACCSQYGYCGYTDTYCGIGCQLLFGSCSESGSSSSSTTFSSTTILALPKGSCGGSSGRSCSTGTCCSQYGYCGSTDAYCGIGCQTTFGSCLESGSSSLSTSFSTVSIVASGISTRTTTAASSTSTTKSQTLTDCLGQRDVPIILPSDSTWNRYKATYNTRLDKTPVVIVLPSTKQHVSDAVICASQAGIQVQAKGGGHSYASFSTPSGGMMIDMENFQNVSVGSNGVATVGAGLRLGNMALAIYNQSNRALPHGDCPGVGIGGHATHGGYGYSSRAWGLALDTIIGLDVVLANGTFIQTSRTSYPDIFWALRGAADSFGVIINFYLQTQPAPSSVINFSYSIPKFYSSVSTAVSVFQHIQDFAQNGSVINRNIGFGLYMDGDDFSVDGTYFGDLGTFKSLIAPELLRTLPSPSSSKVKTYSWIDSLNALGELGTLSTPVHGYSAHDNFFASSVAVPQSSPLTAEALTSYFTYIMQGASTSWYSIIDLYGGPDGQINNKDTTFAAYSNRNSLWVAQHYAYVSEGEFPDSGVSWIEGLNNAMTSQMSGVTFGKYLNYVDSTLSAQQAHDIYYGASMYGQLKALKNKVDPQNVFANPQSI